MEASLLADLERGGFRKILEEKEEGEDEELLEDEKTKKSELSLCDVTIRYLIWE